jgi:hypothetical protein
MSDPFFVTFFAWGATVFWLDSPISPASVILTPFLKAQAFKALVGEPARQSASRLLPGLP